MRRKKMFQIFISAVLACFLSLSLGAQSEFYGDFLFGFRFVGTSGPGADYKYKEDINLRGGVRLYNFSLSYTPENGFRKFFDRLDIRIYNFGGDPFETFAVTLQKHGKYLIRYDRRKSAYFYHDLNRGDGSELYDLHTFDFDRIRDSGLAKIWLAEKADLYLSFDRYTKKGVSTTTFDINRVEFEMGLPIQEESKEIAVGLNLHFNRYSFVLEEKFLSYRNENSLFLPGYADGGPEAVFPTSLNYFYLNEPYDLKSNTHSLRFNARPWNRLFLTGSAQISQLDMDLDYSEQAQGVNYLGRRFTYGYEGTGEFERKIQLYEVDASFVLLRQLTLVGAVRYHIFDQTGSLAVGNEKELLDFGYDTLGVDAGLQYQFSPRLALTLGYRSEDRNLDGFETATYEFDTIKNGGFGNIRWNPSQRLKLTLDYEHSQYADPFTLISPTAFDRLRITAKYHVNALSISGSYLWSDSKSEVFEDVWKSSKNQLSLRLGYHADRLNASGGFSYIQAKRQGDRTVTYPPYWTGPGGTFLWEILYEGKSSLLDAMFSYDLKRNWKIGGYANYYSNKGSWKIERTVLKAYLEYSFTAGYIAQVGYRFVNYKEMKYGHNNYKANIAEMSFGYRWK